MAQPKSKAIVRTVFPEAEITRTPNQAYNVIVIAEGVPTFLGNGNTMKKAWDMAAASQVVQDRLAALPPGSTYAQPRPGLQLQDFDPPQ